MGGAGGAPAGEVAYDPEWATWPMPSWPDSGLPNPPRYTNLGDGTARDEVTGLVWQTEPTASVTWASALQICPAGFRTPSIIELISLSDPMTGRWDAVFAPGLGSLWSSSPVASTPAAGWMLYGGEGDTYPMPTDGHHPVLCVRGGNASGLPHYELTSIGPVPAVRDNWTGLVWQQSVSANAAPFAEAQTYCPALGQGFRVPNIKELGTLVDRHRAAPTIDPSYFPNTPNAGFWSGTSHGTQIAFLVNFETGTANTYGTTRLGYVRCVQ
jgi:hypothetical protein